MSFAEFYVTKGASVSDLNGGGPSLAANDAPIITKANCSSDVPGTGITNDAADGWGAAAADDWICFDTVGVIEYTRITNVAGDVLTVDPAVTGSLAGKNVNVGGAWATADHALSVMGGTAGAAGGLTDWTNAAGDPPRINLKYNAASYDEHPVVDNVGSVAIRLRIEGYESSAGDGCPTPNYPVIEDTSGDAVASVLNCNKLWWDYVNFSVVTAKANDQGINGGGQYNKFINVQCKATGAGSPIAWGQTGANCLFLNCFSEDSTGEGWRPGTNATLIGCVSRSAGTYGFSAGAGNEIFFLYCVADVPGDDGFNIQGEGHALIGCVGYKSTAGSGVRLGNVEDYPQPLILNCIFTENNQFGIEANADFQGHEDYNAFFGNTQGEVSNVPNRGANDVTLTGDPFVGAGAGNFSLDNTAGEGADCRDAGLDASEWGTG